MLVTETWLNDGICDGFLDPRSMYHILRKDWPSCGGGVAAFISRQLYIVEVPLANEFVDLELLCFDVVFTSDKVRFFNIYRPPQKDANANNYTDTLIKCLKFHFAKHHFNIVVGDFNCPQISWNNLSCPASDYVCKAIVNWIITSGLTQFVKFPTRQANILDLVLCDNDQLICNVTSSPPIGHSDHGVVDFTFLVRDGKEHGEKNTNPGKHASVNYKWHEGNFEAIDQHLSTIHWDYVIYNNPSAMESWLAFKNVLWTVIDMHVPSYNGSRCCKYRKRYPQEVVRLIAKKRSLWKKMYASA